MKRIGAAVVLLVAGLLPAAAQDVTSGEGALLRGLDKVAGTTTDLRILNGETASLGSLAITASDCRFPKDNPSADAFAHVTITAAGNQVLFDGWMIASSPALSALDHPRYDVWAIACINS